MRQATKKRLWTYPRESKGCRVPNQGPLAGHQVLSLVFVGLAALTADMPDDAEAMLEAGLLILEELDEHADTRDRARAALAELRGE